MLTRRRQERERERRKGPARHVLFAGVMCLAGAGAADSQVRREYRELHMGMEVRIVVYAPSDSAARAGARAAFDRVAALDGMMSDYRADSEVSLLAAAAPKQVRVSPELAGVLALARAVAAASDGAFDPTAGPLVAAWRVARRSGALLSARARDSVRALVDWRGLVVDSASGSARLARAGMRLDLGAIAKGYVIQQALDVLRARGLQMALIEAGGDIVVGDAPPGAPGWHVDAPHAASSVRRLAGALVNAAISTSGPSAQVTEIGGVRYSHVVDPRTGLPLTTAVHATVIARDAAIADALATALTLLGPGARERLVAAFASQVSAWSAVP